jgi:hypothetical protein
MAIARDEDSGHLNELFAAAEQLIGDVVRNMERTTVANIARVFREHAVGAQWRLQERARSRIAPPARAGLIPGIAARRSASARSFA